MASVKYAISAYTADGTTTDYLITWDYLDEDHIAVYVDGTSNADPTASHTFSKLNDTTLRITDELGNAIVAGSEIEIRRETPLTTRAITFADGSALLASDLNKNSDYLLYSMQEVLDTVDAAAQDGALAAQVATEEFRDEAEGFKNDAETAKNTTQGYLATVQSDATDADNHRIASAASEAAAATSEANAATSETNSANSATASANSATASAASAAASLASEQASAASETAAAASETAAAASETAAATSATAAATSETNAAASFDSFDDRYLGAKATAPTVDNDGDALLTGALYWNTTSDTMYVWNGSSWDTLNSSTGISDGASSTKMSITDTLTTVDTNFNVNTTGYIQLPTGTNAQRPSSPAIGMVRFNTDDGVVEEYRNGDWFPLSNKFSASGGNVETYTYNGKTYRSHTFLSSGTFVANAAGSVEVLLVGGGGGGGVSLTGGGGGGGVMVTNPFTITAKSYSIVVGGGGAGATGDQFNAPTGGQGGTTSAFNINCTGGGGGASRHQSSPSNSGANGGGGSSDRLQSSVGNGAQGVAPSFPAGIGGSVYAGYRGGNGGGNPTNYPGGGGAGANSNGQTPSNSSAAGGNGGNGVQIVGFGANTYYYGGGGGGSSYNGSNSGGYGGAGGGGGGADSGSNNAGLGDTNGRNNGTNGYASFNDSDSGTGGNGGANTGGGGGGGGHSAGTGGSGGSGIVIIRYEV
jgi:hypothetical protein